MPKKEYSAARPDEWAGLEKDHIPRMVVHSGFGKDLIVTVPLKKSSPDHYIEKIGIVDENGKELVYAVFSRHAKYFEARFQSSKLPFRKDDLKIYAKCSLHDVWTVPFNDAVPPE